MHRHFEGSWHSSSAVTSTQAELDPKSAQLYEQFAHRTEALGQVPTSGRISAPYGCVLPPRRRCCARRSPWTPAGSDHRWHPVADVVPLLALRSEAVAPDL